MSEQKGLSRRNFLVGAGVTTGALAALSVGAVSAQAAYTALPWPVATLDLALVKKRGYDAYYVGGCMYGSASALLTTLVETVGAPWDSIPVDMFKYGSGGVAGWGTLCGSINGAAWILQACAGTQLTTAVNALYDWYCNFAFPSRDHDAYALFTRQKTTVANSPLCHASASNWAHSTKNKINSDARKDRCAKLAGDVAGKTAEFINMIVAGQALPGFTQPDATCSGCHVGATSTYDHVQMKSTCTTYCHDDKVSGHY